MLAAGTLQRIRPLKTVRPGNLHLPAVIRLRANNRHLPIPGPLRKQMLDCGDNLRPQRLPRSSPSRD
jgi:hypothetical protein